MADPLVPQIDGPIYNAGAGVANQLQQILARKSMEKRQAVLDALNEKQVNAQIDEGAARTAAYKEEREAVAAQRRQQQMQEWLGTFSVGDNEPSEQEKADHPGWERFFPEQQADQPEVQTEVVEQPGPDDAGNVMEETPEQMAQRIEGANASRPPMMRRQFAGLPEQREERKREEMRAYIQAHPEAFANLNDLQRVALIRMIDPKGALPAGLFNDPQEKRSAAYQEYQDYVNDEQGRGNTKILSFDQYQARDANRRATTGGGQAYNLQPWFNQSNGKTYWVDPRHPERPPVPMTMPEGEVDPLSRTAPKPVNPNAPLFDESTWASYMTKVKDAANPASRVPMQTRKAIVDLALQQVIDSSNTTPEVKLGVSQLLHASNPKIEALSTADIMTHVVDTSTMSPKDVRDMSLMLSRLRGK